jgi:hypothetical protein
MNRHRPESLRTKSPRRFQYQNRTPEQPTSGVSAVEPENVFNGTLRNGTTQGRKHHQQQYIASRPTVHPTNTTLSQNWENRDAMALKSIERVIQQPQQPQQSPYQAQQAQYLSSGSYLPATYPKHPSQDASLYEMPTQSSPRRFYPEGQQNLYPMSLARAAVEQSFGEPRLPPSPHIHSNTFFASSERKNGSPQAPHTPNKEYHQQNYTNQSLSAAVITWDDGHFQRPAPSLPLERHEQSHVNSPLSERGTSNPAGSSRNDYRLFITSPQIVSWLEGNDGGQPDLAKSTRDVHRQQSSPNPPPSEDMRLRSFEPPSGRTSLVPSELMLNPSAWNGVKPQGLNRRDWDRREREMVAERERDCRNYNAASSSPDKNLPRQVEVRDSYLMFTAWERNNGQHQGLCQPDPGSKECVATPVSPRHQTPRPIEVREPHDQLYWGERRPADVPRLEYDDGKYSENARSSHDITARASEAPDWRRIPLTISEQRYQSSEWDNFSSALRDSFAPPEVSCVPSQGNSDRPRDHFPLELNHRGYSTYQMPQGKNTPHLHGNAETPLVYSQHYREPDESPKGRSYGIRPLLKDVNFMSTENVAPSPLQSPSSTDATGLIQDVHFDSTSKPDNQFNIETGSIIIGLGVDQPVETSIPPLELITPLFSTSPNFIDVNILATQEYQNLWSHAILLANAYELEESLQAFRRMRQRMGSNIHTANIPNSALLWANNGLLRAHLGDYFRASKDLRKACMQEPYSPIFWFLLGCIMWELDLWRRAFLHFTTAMAGFPEGVEVLDYRERGLNFLLNRAAVIWNVQLSWYWIQWKRFGTELPEEIRWCGIVRLPGGRLFGPEPCYVR